MPTSLSRTAISHTPAVQVALAKARERWPSLRSDNSRLRAIVDDWAEHTPTPTVSPASNAGRLTRLAGSMPDVFPPDHASNLKAEWPS